MWVGVLGLTRMDASAFRAASYVIGELKLANRIGAGGQEWGRQMGPRLSEVLVGKVAIWWNALKPSCANEGIDGCSPCSQRAIMSPQQEGVPLSKPHF
jgi:hypothetical protein